MLQPSPITKKVNLLGLDKKALQDFFASIGEKPYRADQVLKWIHFNGVQNFQDMTNISKDLRNKLLEIAEVSRLDNSQCLLAQPEITLEVTR